MPSPLDKMNEIARLREAAMNRAQVPPGVSQPMPAGTIPGEEGNATGMVPPDHGDPFSGDPPMQGTQEGAVPPEMPIPDVNLLQDPGLEQIPAPLPEGQFQNPELEDYYRMRAAATDPQQATTLDSWLRKQGPQGL